MNNVENVVERALSSVARTRELRARNMDRRTELQKRAEALAAKPLYILKKYGGRQLSLELDEPQQQKRGH